MIGFYRRMIPRFAEIMHPLTELIRLNPKTDHLPWTNREADAFSAAKAALQDACQLPHPKPTCDTYQLVTDCSAVAAGAVLHQVIEGQHIPIAFYSRKLSQPQSKYSTYDRELLAAYQAVLHFRHHLEGRKVTLVTDHKPLVSAATSQHLAKTDRQQRHWSVILEYVADVAYLRGVENVVADCLSRPIQAITADPLDLSAIAEKQGEDQEVIDYLDRLKLYPQPDGKTLLCDTSTPNPRPFLPVVCRRPIFDKFHNLSHPGVKATLKLLTQRYFWPDMQREIRSWVRECQHCQEAKVHRHTKKPFESFDKPCSRFEIVHIDIVGPLPPSRSRDQTYTSPERYLLTCIDRATRWIEAIPLDKITASNVAAAFMEVWVSRFGVPLDVITDRGSQFEAELFLHLSEILGFRHIRTTAYHPQANGMVERLHRTLKTAIVARNEEWLQSLPVVLLALRTIPNESNLSPFNAVTGTQLLFPKIAIEPQSPSSQHAYVRQLAKHMTQIDFASLSQGHHHAERPIYMPPELSTCTHVWVRVDRVRKPLSAPYKGPFAVVQRTASWFKVKLPSGQLDTVSIDRLKPAVFPVVAEDESSLDNAAPCGETAADTEPPSQAVITDLASQPLPVPEPPRIQTRHVHFASEPQVKMF